MNKRSLSRRIAEALSAPELAGEGYQRMLDVAQRVQLAVGVVALAAIWIVPDVPTKDAAVVTGLLFGVYMPWTVFSNRIALLRTGAVARILNLTVDLLAIGAFAIVNPYTRVAVMFGFTLAVAFHAYVSSREAALFITVGVLTITGVAEWRAPAAERLSEFTLFMYAVVLVALAVMVDALAAERRRTARHLARLHRSLEALTSAPGLRATVDAVAETARAEVDALFVAVLMPEEDRLVSAAVEGVKHNDTWSWGERGLQDAMKVPEHSPSALALQTGDVIVTEDITADERFSRWAPYAERFGFRAMVSLPIAGDGDVFGVLNAYFAPGRVPSSDDVDLLTAYSRQTAVVIARSLAFEQERRAAERLAEADRLKSEFVATVSHELRTPLTSVGGFIDTVLVRWDDLSDADKRQLLERAAWNAGELRRMIEQVLTFSALDATATGLHPSPRRLAHEVRELVAHLQPVLEHRPVTITVPDDIVVNADPTALNAILSNLLTNAAKYSPDESPIEITAQRSGGRAVVSVRDHGPGIAHEQQERVFERFYRATPAGSARGTGIGLAIVRAYVERHGGRVWVESDPGAGATFSFTLALASPAHEAPNGGADAEGAVGGDPSPDLAFDRR